MKKTLMAAVAIASVAPIFVGIGAASAAASYTPELVYAFDTTGDTNYAPESIVTFGSKLAIQLRNGDFYISDGTSAGTTDFTSVAQAAGLTEWWFDRTLYDTYSVDIDGTLYFGGATVSGNGVFKTDGVTVTKVADVDGENNLYYLNGELYASTSANGPVHINISNGDTHALAGTLVYDCNMFQEKRDMQYLNGLIVFTYDDNNCDNHIVTWDPANPSADPVAITPTLGTPSAVGLGRDSSDLDYLDSDITNDWFVWNNEMYFAAYANDGTYNLAVELFKTDGTQAGTTFVKDINDGGQGWSSYPANTNYTPFFVFNNELYFSAEVSSGDIQLWKTDGTTDGTVAAVTDFTSPGDFSEAIPVVLGDKFFQDFDASVSGNEPFMSDGTNAGTTLLVDTYSEDQSGMCWYNCQQSVLFDNRVFFIAWDGTTNQVWSTDGTPAGTSPVTSFEAPDAVGHYNDHELTVLGDALYFGVNDTTMLPAATGNEALYKISLSTTPALPNTGIDALGMTFVGLASVGFISTGVVMVAKRRRANA